MKTVRQDCPASNNITDASVTGGARNPDQAIDVEIASCAPVRFSSIDVNLPDVLRSIGLGDAKIADANCEPVLHIKVAHTLRPTAAIAQRARVDLLIEPSTLWLLSPSGTAVAGLPFGSWDEAITATVTPERLAWVLRLLLPIALPSRGLLPGHGAAYESARGRGIVMSGLPNSGKTGATLAAIARGGKFLADDLVIIDPALGQLYATALPVSVAYSYLQRYPRFKARLSGRLLTKLQIKTTLLTGLARLCPVTLANRLFPRRLAKRWTNLITTRVTVDLPRNVLFEPSQQASSASLDELIVLTAADTGEGTAADSSATATSTRWALALQKDTTELRNLYEQYRYAFPNSTCTLLEDYPVTLRNLLAGLDQQCTQRSLVVNWHQPNPERIRAGIEELTDGE